MSLEFFKSADKIRVLIVFTNETNVRVVLIQYVLKTLLVNVGIQTYQC